ncbi:MAG: hypothetical protein GQ564_06940 [Bacteroidales bacterium]|nr:hypothetical protein [Bacteroidales bacterium]
MRIKELVFLLVIICLIESCVKYSCDGFPNEELKWIPFQIGDSIYYSNEIDTISFLVVDFHKSDSWSDWQQLVMDYWCPTEAYYVTNNNDRLNFSIKQIRRDECINCKNDIEIYFTGLDTISFNDYSRNYDWDSTIYVKYIENMTINQKQMTDVYFLTKKKNISGEYIDSVLIAPDYGILKFYESRENSSWVRVKY